MNVELWNKFTLCQKIIDIQKGKYSLNKILHFFRFQQKWSNLEKFHLDIFLAGIECWCWRWCRGQLPPGPHPSDLTGAPAWTSTLWPHSASSPGSAWWPQGCVAQSGYKWSPPDVESQSSLGPQTNQIKPGERPWDQHKQPGDGVSVNDARFDSEGHRVSFILITSSSSSSSCHHGFHLHHPRMVSSSESL